MAEVFDVVIIGGGAAGVAAGRFLAQTKASFRILEARDRVGGRAYTVERNGMALDLGCGWLHAAAHNYWRAEAEREGYELDSSPPPWGRRVGQSDFGASFARFNERIEAGEREPDRPASDYLKPGDPANEMINSVCTYLNGVTLEHVSAHDYVRYDGAGGNLRAKIGYGGLISALARALPIELNTQARIVDHSGALIHIETNRGAVETKSVIVCAPTPVIAREHLRFAPALPEAVELAGGLPLGTVDKIFVGVDEGALPPGEGRIFDRDITLKHPSYDARPMGRPVIEAFIAGPLAAALEAEGARDAAAFVIDDLVGLLGEGARAKLHVLAVSDWGRDPLSLGSYSYARPGYAEARTTLSQPMAERIFFAGEACAPAFFGTAHGAADTGIAAARLALDHIRRAARR